MRQSDIVLFLCRRFFSVFGSLVAEVKSVFLFISSDTGMLATSLLELIGTYRNLAEFYRSLSGFSGAYRSFIEAYRSFIGTYWGFIGA